MNPMHPPAVTCDAQIERTSARSWSPDECYNRGTELAAIGQHQAAVAEFQAGLERRPQDAAMLNNLGNSWLALGNLVAAEEAFARAMKYDRRNPIILANRAQALNLRADEYRRQGREASALPLLRQALELQPDSAHCWNNLGTVLHDLRHIEEGEQALRHALVLRPDYALAMGNLANLLTDCGRFADALALYERAVQISPESAVAHWNLALAYLAAGDLARGFSGFEWRLRLPHAASLYPERGIPLWRGEPLAGRRILLFAEQGLGDTLQFVRYAPKIAAMGAEVWLECQPPLQRLLTRMPGVTRVITPGEAVDRADFICPLMSLPQRLGTTLADIPSETPYIDVDPDRVDDWARRFPTSPRRFRVGLVWAGEARKGEPDAHRIDKRRSMALGDFSPLLDVAGVDFFSLQKRSGSGPASNQLKGSAWDGRMTDWSEDFTDFVETGALVSHLDLAIGVDTSVIHLSAALGKPTWVLSRFDGCWRWLRDRDDSPWYPTLRLFRQKTPLEWGPVVDAVRAELIRLTDIHGAD